MSPPSPFAVGTYAAWHDATFSADAPLISGVEKLRAGLVANARAELTTLAQVLAYASNYSVTEYYLSAKQPTDYLVSLPEALAAKPGTSSYELLFKSRDSIINKLWRKNQKDPPGVHLGNIFTHITDLVRTDITATTLHSAAFLAARLNALPNIISDPQIRAEYDKAIDAVEFGPEMKMESGYFAYHGLVRFKSGLIVEVQIYSDLMRQWRKLSHVLYEKARVEGAKKYEFDSKESRLVSLGHLLHLAECQLAQLAKEYGG